MIKKRVFMRIGPEAIRYLPWPLAIIIVLLIGIELHANAHKGLEPKPGFVGTEGTHFILDGKPLYIAGLNNHYLTFGSPAEVVRVLDDAVAMGATVVRTFIQPVIGSPDGDNPKTIWNWRQPAYSSHMGVHGTYLVYWDKSRKAMAFNEGPNGMQKLDFLMNEASKRKLKLIVALLDFWAYAGGAQQMRAWYGSEDKSTFFFQDARTKRDYKNLVHSVLLRKNTLTGAIYKDDPTIFAWELMNEGNIEPKSLRLSWTAEMSAYVKSIDANHMVTTGHANIDELSDINIPTVDFATWHGYPIYFKWTVDDMDKRISQYCRVAAEIQKPVILEEFGYARSNPDQASAYQKWLTTIYRDPDCAGWVVWRLVSPQEDLRYPPDPIEEFDVHNDGGPLWTVLETGAYQMLSKSSASGNTNPAGSTR